MRGRSILRWLGAAIVVVSVLGLDGLGAPKSRAQANREDVIRPSRDASAQSAGLTLVPASGAAGTTVSGLGYGFDRSGEFVGLYWPPFRPGQGSYWLADAHSGANGAVAFVFTVPSEFEGVVIPPGSYELYAVGNSSGRRASATFLLTAPFTVGPVTVRAQLGYEAPLGRSYAPPLQLDFTVGDSDALITQVTIDSQEVKQPAVTRRLDGRPLFYDYVQLGRKSNEYSPATRTAQITFDIVDHWGLAPDRFPVEVEFRTTVELTNGQRVSVQATVVIDALYSVGVMREAPPSPNPAQGYDMKVRLDGRVLALRDTVQGTQDRTLRLPSGAVVAARFLDGTAMLMSYDSRDDFFIDTGIGGASAPSEHGEAEGASIKQISVDLGKDRAQDAALKILARGLAGPAGTLISVFDPSRIGGRGLVVVRLRSEVGIAVLGTGEVTVQSFEGTPELLRPDGEPFPLPAGQRVTVSPDGEVSGPETSPVADPIVWLGGTDSESPAPAAPPAPTVQPTRPALLAVPTPTPPFVQPTRPAQFVLPTPTAPFVPLTPTPTFVPPTPTTLVLLTPTAPLTGPTATTAAAPQFGQETVLFDNSNIGGVSNGPSAPTTFTLTSPALITSMISYHWNNGRGTSSPGTLSLLGADGTSYEPWPAVGSTGQGGVPNAYWTVQPGVLLPAGSYTVIDSDRATWSQNTGSGHAGISWVKGRPAQ